MKPSAVPRSQQAGVFDERCGLGEPAQLLVQLAHGQKAGVGRDLSALETRDELLILIETEGQLLATVCHLKASLVAGTRVRLAPILPAQEAFSLGNGFNLVNNPG